MGRRLSPGINRTRNLLGLPLTALPSELRHRVGSILRVKNGGGLASITAVICPPEKNGSIISEQMRSLSKTACAFLSLILAIGMATASTAPAGPKKKTKRAPAASTRHTEIIPVPHSDTLSITTSSSEARVLYEAGLRAWETVQIDSALKRWRTAINVDPHFALGHLFLSYCTPDPLERANGAPKSKIHGLPMRLGIIE